MRPRQPQPVRRRRPATVVAALAFIAAAAAVAPPPPAVAHETDQFTLPPADDFADLGPDVTRWYTELLVDGVARANARIAAGIARGYPDWQVAELQKATNLANAVDESCLRGNDIVDAVERELAAATARGEHGGRRIFYREADHNIYENAFSVLDLRILSRYWFGSTVKLFGHYVGTDKFGHFTAIGVSYYWRYEQAKAAGATEAEATAAAVRFGTEGRWSESDLMGITTTGDYANGDLSANFAGFLFFRNLAEPTFVDGTVRPPLCVRDGPYWRLAAHVRPDTDWFRPFVTDHWNEALNPGYFVESMRPALRDNVRGRADTVLRYYARPGLSPADARDDLRRRRLELSTYWGIDYGHRGDDETMVTIDNTCFESER